MEEAKEQFPVSEGTEDNDDLLYGRLRNQEADRHEIVELNSNDLITKKKNPSRCDLDETILDLSHLYLDSLSLNENFENSVGEDNHVARYSNIQFLYLHHNRLDYIPLNINVFESLKVLDLSNNNLYEINDSILALKQLNTFVARNNYLGDYSLPKKLHTLTCLESINFSGNNLRTIPYQILELSSLKALYLGGNQIEDIPRDVWKLERLEILYLGGNFLREIPAEMGKLHSLQALVLCENQLQSLPSSISCLRKLRSLALHKNQLTTLPPEIVTLRGLIELSLRDNPLVVRFVRDMTYDPPSLQELAARCIKIYKVHFNDEEMPPNLVSYLRNAQRCVNLKCKGVYFDARVEHIKFVDFCGKYRLPLLQYLCSPHCSTQPAVGYNTSSEPDTSDDDCEVPASKLKRVLLG